MDARVGQWALGEEPAPEAYQKYLGPLGRLGWKLASISDGEGNEMDLEFRADGLWYVRDLRRPYPVRRRVADVPA